MKKPHKSQKSPKSDKTEGSETIRAGLASMGVITKHYGGSIALLQEHIRGTAEAVFTEIVQGELPDPWRRQILRIIQTEVERIMKSQTIQNYQTELPPYPVEKIRGEKGKPVLPGERVKLAGTVDRNLAQALEQWRKERGISLSRALDTVLWHFLGKPPLSFESAQPSEVQDKSGALGDTGPPPRAPNPPFEAVAKRQRKL